MADRDSNVLDDEMKSEDASTQEEAAPELLGDSLLETTVEMAIRMHRQKQDSEVCRFAANVIEGAGKDDEVCYPLLMNHANAAWLCTLCLL